MRLPVCAAVSMVAWVFWPGMETDRLAMKDQGATSL